MVGAVISLAVSILAGCVVWLLTHEPKSTTPEEKLRYSMEEVASFSPTATKIGIVTIKIFNQGDKAARDVRGVFVLPVKAEIKAKQITMSSGPAGIFIENPSDTRTINLTLPTLAPNETLTASLLVEGSGPFLADVGLRSTESVGISVDPRAISVSPHDLDRSPTRALAVMVLLWALGPFVILFFWRKKIFEFAPVVFPSINDTSFVYLQQKMVVEAKQMLLQKINSKGSDVFETANLALALGLSDQLEESNRLFQIAEWWALTNHSKAVISYDQATLYAAKGDFLNAKQKLREAMALSSRHIAKYYKLSAWFAEATKIDPEFDLIAQNSKK